MNQKRKHIPPEDKRLFFKFNRSQHLLYTRLEQECQAALGITPVQLGAIFFLLENDGCLQKDLARGLHLNKPAVTGLAARMEKAGLVTREGCSRDARASRIFLTDAARGTASRAFPLLEKLNKALTDGFSEKEILVVHRFFDSIIAAFAKEDVYEQDP